MEVAKSPQNGLLWVDGVFIVLTAKAVLKMGVRELDLVQEYTGYSYDMVLGIFYAKARMYDANDRRFMAVDPVRGSVANVQTMAQYTYCLDNPIKYVDPLGLAAIPWDQANLSKADQAKVAACGEAWQKANAAGDEAGKAAAHAAAEAIRDQYRTGSEKGTADGNTVGTPAAPKPENSQTTKTNPNTGEKTILDKLFIEHEKLESMTDEEVYAYAEKLNISVAQVRASLGSKRAEADIIVKLKQEILLNQLREWCRAEYNYTNGTKTGNQMMLDDKGINMIANLERALSDIVYNEKTGWIIGIPTTSTDLGYGHDVNKNPISPLPASLTALEALALLLMDAPGFEEKVNSVINVTLTQDQFNALISYVYNVGSIGAVDGFVKYIEGGVYDREELKNIIISYYDETIKNNPANEKYRNGWYNRTEKFLNIFFDGNYGYTPIDAINGRVNK